MPRHLATAIDKLPIACTCMHMHMQSGVMVLERKTAINASNCTVGTVPGHKDAPRDFPRLYRIHMQGYRNMCRQFLM